MWYLPIRQYHLITALHKVLRTFWQLFQIATPTCTPTSQPTSQPPSTQHRPSSPKVPSSSELPIHDPSLLPISLSELLETDIQEVDLVDSEPLTPLVSEIEKTNNNNLKHQ